MKCCRCGKPKEEARWYKTSSSTMCADCQIIRQKELRDAREAGRDEQYHRSRKIGLTELARRYNLTHPFRIDRLQMAVSLRNVVEEFCND